MSPSDPHDHSAHQTEPRLPGRRHSTPPRVVTLTPSPSLDDSFTVERLVTSRKMRCTPPRTDPGGGGVNVARILHALDVEALAVFPLAGYLGQALHHLLDLEGVATAGVPVAGETRQCHHVIDRENGQEYRFVLPGPHLSDHDRARCLDAVRKFADHAEYVVLSGSFPPDVPASYVTEVARVAEDVGARLVVDTSGDPLAEVQGAYLLKPSLRELETLVGAQLPSLEEQVSGAQQFLRRSGSSVLVLSRGHRGAVLVTGDEHLVVPAPEADVVTTVGAGDALVAGTVAGLSKGWDVERSVRLGVACSAAMTETTGTELFTASALAAFTDEAL